MTNVAVESGATGRPTMNRRAVNWYYTTFATSISTSGSLSSLAPVNSGTGYNGRLKSSILLKKIRVRLLALASLQSSISTADIYNNLRVIIVLAKGPASGISTGDFPSVFSQFDMKEPLRLLYDRTVFLNNYASGAAAAGNAYGCTPSGIWLQDAEGSAAKGYFDIDLEQMGLSLRDRTVVFDSTSGTSDDNNMPLVYFVSDSTVSPNPTINGEIRVIYEDLLV